MPVITMKTGKTLPDQKKELIEKLTKAAVEVTSFPAEAYTVFIEEYENESVGVGGQPLSEMSNK